MRKLGDEEILKKTLVFVEDKVLTLNAKDMMKENGFFYNGRCIGRVEMEAFENYVVSFRNGLNGKGVHYQFASGELNVISDERVYVSYYKNAFNDGWAK